MLGEGFRAFISDWDKVTATVSIDMNYFTVTENFAKITVPDAYLRYRNRSASKMVN